MAETNDTGKGQRIIDGLKDAIAGNFASVTIDGQTWQRVDRGSPASPPEGWRMIDSAPVLKLSRDDVASLRTALIARVEVITKQLEEDYYHNIDEDGRRCAAMLARIQHMDD